MLKKVKRSEKDENLIMFGVKSQQGSDWRNKNRLGGTGILPDFFGMKEI